MYSLDNADNAFPVDLTAAVDGADTADGTGETADGVGETGETAADEDPDAADEHAAAVRVPPDS